MSAGNREYLWADEKIVDPVRVTAPDYFRYLKSWVEEQIYDESIFPSRIGGSFPKNFLNVVKYIWRRCFRVYVHIYYDHFSQVAELEKEQDINTHFWSFYRFVKAYEIIVDNELAPLEDLIGKLNIT